MIQELSLSSMAYPRGHNAHDQAKHHFVQEEAKKRTCSSESDRSFRSDRSGNNSFTSQRSCCTDETTTHHDNNKGKKMNKKSHTQHNTIDSDFVTYFICRRP
ncbi:uncharacterized protein [Macrobrachium rosenbergii]|uniref:uncharacterized protein isoform X2 n=1 Tax=Macrobrachium rosenbergii TaxID=79674 RepID=UPI0034D44956